MMVAIISWLIGCIGGALAVWFSANPMKSFQEGYESAKSFYSDYNRGFDDGWNGAHNVFKDYDRGFYDGYDAGVDVTLSYMESENRGA